MQEAETAVKNIFADLKGKPRQKIEYKDRGSMATIGRNVAVVQFRKWHFDGFFAWILWLAVRVITLIDYRSRFAVLSEWMWAYFTRERSARLITGSAADLNEAARFIETRPPAAQIIEKEKIETARAAATS